MIAEVMRQATPVVAILYIAIGGTILLSSAIVWLSGKLKESPDV